MVMSCCAYGCTYRYKKGDGISFFRFPNDKKHCMLWINAVRRKNWNPTPSSRICGQHFQTGKPVKDENHPDYIPNIFSFRKPTASVAAYEQRIKTIEKKEHNAQCGFPSTIIQGESSSSVTDNILTQAEYLDEEEMDENDKLKEELTMAYEEINALRHEKEELQNMHKDMDLTLSILNDPKKFLFYTGLPSAKIFDWLISVVKSVNHNVKKVPLKTQILIVLIKLKLNLLSSDIAYRFNLHLNTLRRIFDFWIPYLAQKLKSLIHWVEKRVIRKHLPLAFKTSDYKDAVCIIDCTEVPIQRPSSQLAKSQTWSSYKNAHTIKFLVGITPNGYVSFLSKTWGGRASDKKIFVDSNFIDKINPGDVILADRGFIVSDYFTARGAKLIVPTYARSKKQLYRHEVEYSKKVSNVRIHVERVIRQIKKFRILQTPIPIKFLKYIDNVVILCTALANLCGSVV